MNLKYTLKRWYYRRKMKIPMISKFSAKTFIEDPTNFSIDLKNLSYEELIEVFINFVLVYDFNGTNHQLDDNFPLILTILIQMPVKFLLLFYLRMNYQEIIKNFLCGIMKIEKVL
jgi:hypothetical protein